MRRVRRPPSPQEIRGAIIAHVLPASRIAVAALSHNLLRAGLTSLGILFGVASVIAMLAIGKGAEQEILAQMQLLGTNNIVIQPLVEQDEGVAKDEEDEKETERFSPGLTILDAQSIGDIIGEVDTISGEVVLQTSFTREGRRRSGKLVGVDRDYFQVFNLQIAHGSYFSPMQSELASPVCVIGDGVRARFFTTEQPLGRQIKVGDTWLTVVGILKDREMPQGTAGRLGIRDVNMDIYTPLSTMLLRYRNRAQVTNRDIEAASGGDDSEEPTDPQIRAERTNYHQLDRIIVRVEEARFVPPVAEVVQRMLTRRHNRVIDFEVIVPELLLKQEQRTKTIFNIVLGTIASISLIVGGIGIMNIMLSSVMERIREIGVRRAVGAKRRDILAQFLAEAILISLTGGVIGILAGGGLSFAIERLAGIRTIVSAVSIFVAFGVSIAVGVFFGLLPAYRAAQMDPIVSLRHE
jgi:putative ABC transport system permease protein